MATATETQVDDLAAQVERELNAGQKGTEETSDKTLASNPDTSASDQHENKQRAKNQGGEGQTGIRQ